MLFLFSWPPNVIQHPWIYEVALRSAFTRLTDMLVVQDYRPGVSHPPSFGGREHGADGPATPTSTPETAKSLWSEQVRLGFAESMQSPQEPGDESWVHFLAECSVPH